MKLSLMFFFFPKVRQEEEKTGGSFCPLMLFAPPLMSVVGTARSSDLKPRQPLIRALFMGLLM